MFVISRKIDLAIFLKFFNLELNVACGTKLNKENIINHHNMCHDDTVFAPTANLHRLAFKTNGIVQRKA
jgi:hypothetical protein